MNEPNAFSATELQGLSDLYARVGRGDTRRRSRRAAASRIWCSSSPASSGRTPAPEYRPRSRTTTASCSRRTSTAAASRPAPSSVPTSNGRAARRRDIRRRTGVRRRVGERTGARRGPDGRVLPHPPAAAGRVPLLGRAVDVARIVRRPAQGGRRTRGADPVGVGRVGGRLPDEHRHRAPPSARRPTQPPVRARRAGPTDDHDVRPGERRLYRAPVATRPAATDVVAWYPTRLHDPPTLTTLGLEHIRTRSAPGGGVYVIGTDNRRAVAPRRRERHAMTASRRFRFGVELHEPLPGRSWADSGA